MRKKMPKFEGPSGGCLDMRREARAGADRWKTRKPNILLGVAGLLMNLVVGAIGLLIPLDGVCATFKVDQSATGFADIYISGDISKQDVESFQKIITHLPTFGRPLGAQCRLRCGFRWTPSFRGDGLISLVRRVEKRQRIMHDMVLQLRRDTGF
jgi:hypothetical protein